MKNENFSNIFSIVLKFIWSGIQIFGSIIIIIFLSRSILHSTNFTTKIIITPFLICAITGLGMLISSFFKKVNLENLFQKIYIIGFLLFWFGILIFGCYLSLTNKEYHMLFFTIPFWTVGIYMIYKHFIKKQ